MDDTLVSLLALNAPLAPLAVELAAEWEAAAMRRAFAARDVLFAPADTNTALYLIGAGRVKLTAVSSEGKELILALFGRGDLLGELSSLPTGPHHAFAEALEAGWAWSVPLDDVRRSLARNPVATLAFMQLHDARARQLEQRLANLVFLEVPQRLAATLLDLRAEPGPVELTHYDLAGLIGSTRETTTLILNKFRNAGWVTLHKRNVHVQDREALADFAAGRRTLNP